MALPVPTRLFLKVSPDMAMLFAPFRCTHPPPPILPFCWSRAYLQRTLLEMTSWSWKSH